MVYIYFKSVHHDRSTKELQVVKNSTRIYKFDSILFGQKKIRCKGDITSDFICEMAELKSRNS